MGFALGRSRPGRKVDQDTPYVAVVPFQAGNYRAVVIAAFLVGLLLDLNNQQIFPVMSLSVDDHIGQYQLLAIVFGEVKPLGLKAVTIVFDIYMMFWKSRFQI